jgi:hypothetical protein
MAIKYLTIPELHPKEVDSFLSKIHKTETCWIWNSCYDNRGYGRVSIRNQYYRASRVSFHIHNGSLGDGLEVCHSCDNPPCVNPDHLFLGTRTDNERDKWAKGRGNDAFNRPENKARGERINTNKLTEGQVLDVIDRLKRGERPAAIGNLYGVTYSCIYLIKTGKNWAHLPR